MTQSVPSDRTAQINGLLANLAALLADQQAPEPALPPRPRVLLTVAEAAEQLGIGRTTAWALVRSGDLGSVQIGRLRRIHTDAIADYAARLVAGRPAA